MPWLWLSWLGCAPHRYPDGTGIEGQLEREVIAARVHIEQLEAELAACGQGGITNTLYPELNQVFQGTDVEVVRDGSVTRLVVRVSHLFADPYALKFRAEGDPTVDLIATALQIHPDLAVTVVGHTNDRPMPSKYSRIYTNHVDLASRTAGALVQRLVTEFACDPARFTVAGRGPYAPRESNDLESGRDANQRLEIWIHPPSVAPPSPE